MGLDNERVIDYVSFEQKTDTVVLTLCDAWDWEDEMAHLLALQNKLNTYFEFIESGQLLETEPLAALREVRIDIYTMHPLTPLGHELVKAAGEAAIPLGVHVTAAHHPFPEN